MFIERRVLGRADVAATRDASHLHVWLLSGGPELFLDHLASQRLSRECVFQLLQHGVRMGFRDDISVHKQQLSDERRLSPDDELGDGANVW